MKQSKEQKTLEEGIRLFNAGKHYESHEEFESIWLTASGDKKLFLQILILLAAVEVHKNHARLQTARRVLVKIKKKIDDLSEINLYHLRKEHLTNCYIESHQGQTPVIPHQD